MLVKYLSMNCQSFFVKETNGWFEKYPFYYPIYSFSGCLCVSRILWMKKAKTSENPSSHLPLTPNPGIQAFYLTLYLMVTERVSLRLNVFLSFVYYNYIRRTKNFASLVEFPFHLHLWSHICLLNVNLYAETPLIV